MGFLPTGVTKGKGGKKKLMVNGRVAAVVAPAVVEAVFVVPDVAAVVVALVVVAAPAVTKLIGIRS